MNKMLDATFDEESEVFSTPKVTQRKRILVVDDDEGTRQLILLALAQSGYEVDEAENGIIAWKALHLKSYDLLITDNNMPQMTGLQLIEKLRTAGFQLPIALASGSVPTDISERNSTLRLGAVIPKPFAVDELDRTVKDLLATAPTNIHHLHRLEATGVNERGSNRRQSTRVHE